MDQPNQDQSYNRARIEAVEQRVKDLQVQVTADITGIRTEMHNQELRLGKAINQSEKILSDKIMNVETIMNLHNQHIQEALKLQQEQFKSSMTELAPFKNRMVGLVAVLSFVALMLGLFGRFIVEKLFK